MNPERRQTGSCGMAGAIDGSSNTQRTWPVHRMAALLCAVAIGVVALGPAAGGPASAPASGPSAEAELQAKIARAIKDLGADDWQKRDSATKLLWKIGQPAEAALKAAAKSEDLEVRVRAESVLEKFRYGIYPDTPEEVVALIRRYRNGDQNARVQVIGELRELKRHDILAMFLSTETNSTLRRLLQQEIRQMAGHLVRQGRYAQIASILESGLETGSDESIRHFAAWHLMRGSLAEQIRKYEPAGDNVEKNAKIQSYLHRANGDLAKAAVVSMRTRELTLTERILYEQGQWAQLLKRRAWERAGLAEIEALGFKAAYARLSGDEKSMEKALAALVELPTENDDVWDKVEALLINDRVEQAVELLIDKKDYHRAFRLRLGQGRYRSAMKIVSEAQKKRESELVSGERVRTRAPLALEALGEEGLYEWR